jgi:hypothetical protein
VFVTSLAPGSGQSVAIDGPAVVAILSVRGSYVRLGITADASVRIRLSRSPDSSAPPCDPPSPPPTAPPIDPEVGADIRQTLSQGMLNANAQ